MSTHQQHLLDEENNTPLDLGQARDFLCEALDGIEGNGSFCTFDKFKAMADPQLIIDGGPPIKLPLFERDARRIIAASHAAPFGKGEATIIDPTVRKTWELNADQFHIQNPAFGASVNEALNACIAGLGLQGEYSVLAEPYKLLLYEEGALFRPHTESKSTEKVPGMFATMIIVLPSGHEGGMLELSHNGKVVHFGSSQLLQGAFGAWFSDVTHEIKEITAGYRLVLTYNLVNETPGAHFSAGSLDQQLVALGQALASWYTDASLRIDTLKGPDLGKAKAVQHFAAQNGLVLYLASMEKYILYDGDEEDELDSSLKLDRLVDVGGRKFAGGISIDAEEIISCDPYDGRDPTEQTHEDYTGNAGATSTHWYRDTVLVIRKREHNVHLLLKSGEAGYSYSGKKPDVGSLLGKHLEVARRNPGDNAARLDVLAICQYVIDKNVNGRYDWNRISDEIVSKVVEALATVQADRKQLHQAVKALSAKGTLASQAFGALGATVQGPDADKTLAFVLKPAIDKVPSLGGRFTIFQSLFGDGMEKAVSPLAKGFAASSLLEAFLRPSVQAQFDEEDAAALVGFSTLPVVRDSTKVKFDIHILPKLTANIKNTIFVVSFLEAWLAQATPLFGKDYVNAILHQIWKPMVMHFHVDRPTPQPQTHSSMYGAARQEFGTLDKDVRLAMTLARLLTGISRDDIPVDSCELIEAILKDTTRMAPTVLRQILLPFLRHALPWATAAVQDQKFTTPLRDMYQTGLNAYLKSYVKSQPQQGGGFSRPRLHCSCNHCWDVNIFLASATQQVGRFRLSKNARHHVHAYLDNAGFDGTHQTERTWVEPQTLVVTKRNRQGETYNAWLARCREAHGGLHRFEAEGLRKVLSEPVMKDIMAMRCIINDPPAAPEFLPRYVADVVEQPAATRAGVKRKAEVIDLSGDSD